MISAVVVVVLVLVIVDVSNGYMQRVIRSPRLSSSSSSSSLKCTNTNDISDDDELMRKINLLYDTNDNTNLQWSIDDDRALYDAFKNNGDTSSIAISLKRGINGVENRLKKILDPNTNAYTRLFGNNNNDNDNDNDGSVSLKPANEVITRLLYDQSLDKADFSFVYYDREEGMIERPLNANNESVKGKERLLVKALPEHRIRQFLYKNRVIWDRSERLDLVFASGKGPSVKLEETIMTYDDWLLTENQRINSITYQLFCDLDGVLADFNDAVYRIFKKNPAELKPQLLWSRLATTPNFYANLNLMPNGQLLWDTIKDKNPIILTGCPSGNWAEPQKRIWVKERLGESYQVITTKNQAKKCQHVINERDGKKVISILIDDREKAKQAWEENGGVFILYDDSNMIDALQELKKYINDINIPDIPDRLTDYDE